MKEEKGGGKLHSKDRKSYQHVSYIPFLFFFLQEFLIGPFSSSLEFSTGKQKIDRAACVLRFLHIVTLRQLQVPS